MEDKAATPEAPRADAAFEAAKPPPAARLLQALGGFKLTLSLFAALGVLSAIGSLLPQGEEAPRIAELYGPGTWRLLAALGLDDVYRSPWFLLVLALMGLNLILVTWVRVPHVWRISREADANLLKDPLVPKTAFMQSWDCALAPAEALLKSRRALSREFPRLAHQEGPRRSLLIGEKHFLSLWAAHIVHLGLLLLLLGGGLKLMLGSERQLLLSEGQSAPVLRERLHLRPSWVEVPLGRFNLKLPRLYERVLEDAGFGLGLDRFEVRYYPESGAPSLFRSDLKILRGGQVERAVSVKVNEPLEIDGMSIGQASWGYRGLYDAEFEVLLPGQADRLAVRAPYQREVKLLDTGWSLEVTDFLPDAQMAAPGKLENGSDELRNPAIRVRFKRAGRELSHSWFVYAMPEIQMAKVPGLKLYGKTVNPVAFSVLQVNADPGEGLAALGAGLVVLGVFAAFYLFYRKAWVLVEPREDGGSRLTLAGFVRRNRAGFRRVFQRLSAALEAELKADSNEAKP